MLCLFSLLDSAEMTAPKGEAYDHAAHGLDDRVSLGLGFCACRKY